jgi:hypothetical protein
MLSLNCLLTRGKHDRALPARLPIGQNRAGGDEPTIALVTRASQSGSTAGLQARRPRRPVKAG